jgi:hypothetical protein
MAKEHNHATFFCKLFFGLNRRICYAGGLNLEAYCWNNPINRIDALGLCAVGGGSYYSGRVMERPVGVTSQVFSKIFTCRRLVSIVLKRAVFLSTCTLSLQPRYIIVKR